MHILFSQLLKGKFISVKRKMNKNLIQFTGFDASALKRNAKGEIPPSFKAYLLFTRPNLDHRKVDSIIHTFIQL